MPELLIDKIRVNGEVFNQPSFSAAFDKQGFLWLCTDDGLMRFDGYTLKSYRQTTGAPHAVVSEYIDLIMLDKQGVFWLVTHEGLTLFDPATEQFSAFELTLPDAFEHRIYHIYQDRYDDIWMSTAGGGLYRINPKTREMKHFGPFK
ncbi:MAG: hypothetical protein MJK04_31380, partial [Psychrosphaera sp.]|nr:hypothetical protein [Psychrosphaera sp.]